MAAPRTPDEAIAWLAALSPSTVRLGLDRVQAALKLLKNPETHFPAIHVAGTNGKGSTCAFAAACLTAQGYRVGLYTSPHLQRFNERIKISGQNIRDTALGECILEVLAVLGEAPQLTFFEFGTVVALQHFAQERVDVAVLETGLGGRLDATTAARPVVTAITPVSLDHMEYLGHSVQAIAAEKAGIFKPRVPAVIARQTPEVQQVLEKAARQVGAPLRLQGRDFDFEPDGAGKYTYRGMRTAVTGLWPGLRGPHQVQNAAVALACLELLEDQGLRISQQNARLGLAETEWPGRLEEFPGTPRVVLDGAHNPAGVEVLVKAMQVLYPGKPIHLVFGVLADKEYRAMMRGLFPKCASVQLAPVGNPRALEPGRYLDEARALLPLVAAHATPALALEAARKAALTDGGLVLGAGSLFLIGQLRDLLG